MKWGLLVIAAGHSFLSMSVLVYQPERPDCVFFVAGNIVLMLIQLYRFTRDFESK